MADVKPLSINVTTDIGGTGILLHVQEHDGERWNDKIKETALTSAQADDLRDAIRRALDRMI